MPLVFRCAFLKTKEFLLRENDVSLTKVKTARCCRLSLLCYSLEGGIISRTQWKFFYSQHNLAWCNLKQNYVKVCFLFTANAMQWVEVEDLQKVSTPHTCGRFSARMHKFQHFISSELYQKRSNLILCITVECSLGTEWTSVSTNEAQSEIWFTALLSQNGYPSQWTVLLVSHLPDQSIAIWGVRGWKQYVTPKWPKTATHIQYIR